MVLEKAEKFEERAPLMNCEGANLDGDASGEIARHLQTGRNDKETPKRILSRPVTHGRSLQVQQGAAQFSFTLRFSRAGEIRGRLAEWSKALALGASS